MHMHLVMFQVLDRQAFDEIDGAVVPIGTPVAPPPQEAGWKDTVQVGPNEIVRVIARFEGYAGLFSYHCHILEHEDHEMMRQFNAITACSDGVDNDGDTFFDYPADPECTSPHDLSETDDCSDGLDNDGDGLADFSEAGGGDPGCAFASDETEKDAALPCDDGIDNDGDGRIDFDVVTYNDSGAFHAGMGDPGCFNASSPTESPQCQDGIDNDLDGAADFDRGASASGGVLTPGVDSRCIGRPWINEERDPNNCSAGGGGSLATLLLLLLVPFIGHLRRRRPDADHG